MYEQYYGFNAPPFQIHPDPSFYFESKGHGSAYQYLRFGAFQGEGFIVVTGEIGAGKTTLLRALLQELDPQKVVAAQLVSTQLGADDLLAAVALAFGIRTEGLSKAKLLVTLEAFLATLATSSRRALLIIDEAQNLSLESIEELRMLSNFQFGNRVLLQSFLVGQPELRDMLRQPSMEQLRQRVLASFHLGPMDSAETRGYVEHRLRHVGWQGRPEFEPRAFELIHQASGGVPRRINMLCNRLLLSAFLDEASRIDAERVRRVEREMRDELSSGTAVASRVGAQAAAPVLLCVAGSVRALWAIAVLQQAFAKREDMPQVQLLRVIGECAIADDAQALADLQGFGVEQPGAMVPLGQGSAAQCMGQAVHSVASQVLLHEPVAVLIAGDDLVELAAALAAMAARVPLVRIDAGVRSQSPGRSLGQRAAMLDRATQLGFVADEDAQQQMFAQDVPREAVNLVGSIAADAVRLRLANHRGLDAVLRREGLGPALLSDPAGYVLVVLLDPDAAGAETLVDLDLSLRGFGWRVNLICPVDTQRRHALAEACAQAMAGDVRVIQASAHDELLGLVRQARCVLSDDPWLRAQAFALGVPCVELPGMPAVDEAAARPVRGAGPSKHLVRIAREVADIIASGGRRVLPPALFDGHAADRVAAALADWLLGRQDAEYRRYLHRT